MLYKDKKKLAILSAILSTAFLISACAGTTSPSEVRVVYPTVYVTQYVTQVVATAPATSVPVSQPKVETPAPTEAQLEPVEWDPFSVEIYYPKLGCSASRLHVGDRAFIVSSGGLIGLYRYKSLSFEPNLRHPAAGTEVEIIDGPFCDEMIIYWKVRTPDKELVGYYPEGDGNTYWLLPLAPSDWTPNANVSLYSFKFRWRPPPGRCSPR
jgi:hypothetical protein